MKEGAGGGEKGPGVMETLGPVYSRVSFYVEYSSYHADAAELRVLSIYFDERPGLLLR